MARKLIALLDIGQTQDNTDADFLDVQLNHAIDFVTIAPLDAYEPHDLAERFKPLRGDLPISSMTKHGERILVSKSYLVPELQQGLCEAARKEAITALITCTGEFDLGATTIPLVLPGNILRDRVQSEGNNIQSVAVLVPVNEQQGPLTERWSERLPRTRIQAFTLSPQASIQECGILAGKIRSEGFDTVVLDCFGFTRAQHKSFELHIPRVFSAKDSAINFILAM